LDSNQEKNETSVGYYSDNNNILNLDQKQAKGQQVVANKSETTANQEQVLNSNDSKSQQNNNKKKDVSLLVTQINACAHDLSIKPNDDRKRNPNNAMTQYCVSLVQFYLYSKTNFLVSPVSVPILF